MISYILNWFSFPEPVEQKQKVHQTDTRKFNQELCDEFFDFYIRIGGDVSNYDVDAVVDRFKY